MADDKIKIYGELESGVPDGKVTDIRQVNMGTLHIDPEGFKGEHSNHPMIKSEPGFGLGNSVVSGFVISPNFIGFESSTGCKYGLYYENTIAGSFRVVSSDGVFTKENVDQNNENDIANVGFVTTKIKESLKTFPTVTTYPYPSQRNIEVQENAFTLIWQNITVPARSEVYARVTVNLNASPAEGQRIALGFVSEGLNIAATAAPLPVVSGVEHSMCLTHWFEEETTLSVAVHSTTTAYVTNIVSPLDAKMNGGTELIIKTYA